MIKPFEGIFGNNCELRIVEYLLPLEGVELNISELAEEAGVSRPTADRVVKKFVEWGIMKPSRKKAGITYYEINPESPFLRLFQDLNNLVIERMLGEEMLYEIHDYFRERTALPSGATGAKPERSAPFAEESVWPALNRESARGEVVAAAGADARPVNSGGEHNGPNAA